jgi:SAM-dependent methyltransferase
VWQSQNSGVGRSRLSRFAHNLRRALRHRTPDLGDDWNTWWAEQFNGYQALPKTLENAVELGCGPYTNMRLITEGRTIGHIFCSDPLAKQYVTFRGRWLAEAWRTAEVLIDDHPLEECPFASAYFDLVVLINVLDHTRDLPLCLQQAVRITKPGGYLVVGQDLSDADDAQRTAGDVGHPVRVDHHALDEELVPCFAQVLYRILPRDEGRNPSAHYGTYLFIGKKTP